MFIYESMFIYNHLYKWLLANPYQFDRLINLLNLSLKFNLIWRASRDLISLSHFVLPLYDFDHLFSNYIFFY